MATLGHWNDPAFSSPYELALLRSPYLAFHVAGALLTAVVGDAELATRLLLAVAGAALPLAFRSLLRAAGRDERLAIFGCLPFWSRPLVIGFLPFVASIPLALFGVGLAFRAVRARRPRTRTRVGLAVVGALLFYTHVSTWMVFTASTVAIALLAKRWRELLALAPGSIAAASWLLLGRLTLRAESLSAPGEIARMSPARALLAMPAWIFDVWRTRLDDVAALAWWGAFLLVVLVGARSMTRHSRRATVFLYAPFVCALCIYMATPFRVGAALMLNVRLAPVLVLLAFLPTRWPRRSRLATATALSITVANLFGGTAAFAACRAARDELGAIDPIVDAIPRGARLLTLSFDIRSRTTHIFPWAHVGSYHRVRGGGVASFSFSELRHWPVQYRAADRPPAKEGATWDYGPCTYRNAIDGPYYDFVLVRGDVNPFVSKPPGPTFEKVLTSGTMTLYRKGAGEWPATGAPDPGPCVPPR
jgi:hypothetical protein